MYILKIFNILKTEIPTMEQIVVTLKNLVSADFSYYSLIQLVASNHWLRKCNLYNILLNETSCGSTRYSFSLWHRSDSLFLFAGLPHFSVNTLRAIAGLFSSKHFPFFFFLKKTTVKIEHGIVHKRTWCFPCNWQCHNIFQFLVTQCTAPLSIRDQAFQLSATCVIAICTEALSLYNDTP
jgi:hypothetical protein